MRIWLIKMLYRSLSPCGQWECHEFLKQPSLDSVMLDQCERIDKNWLRSKTYKTDSKVEVDLNKCPKCGGHADNGHDRCLPPSPYFCTKCTKSEQGVE